MLHVHQQIMVLLEKWASDLAEIDEVVFIQGDFARGKSKAL